MRPRTYSIVATLLTAGGVAFSGYLSLKRLTSGICAFNEPCPFFLGHPACYTGFALFAIAFVISAVALVGKTGSRWPMIANTIVALGGSVFAASLTVKEVAAPASYGLGLPTCAYGLVFFVALAVVSIAAWLHHAHADGATGSVARA